jgi:ribosome biogenesis GTPase
MKGVVYKSTGSWYVVKTEEGDLINSRIKGIFKIDGISSTNPIAVGDEVIMDLENEVESTYIITNIGDRKNYIARSSPHNKRQHHIVASNLDQVVLFATLKDPKTSQGFIDRFLLTAEAYHIPAVIVFNKADIYRKKELERFDRLNEIYTTIGYTVIKASAKTGENVDVVKELLHNKVSLLSGHSGVGKSTFINAVFPEMELRTGEVSEWSGKGMHTTTFAEMFDLPGGGSIIDTPGLREFGIIGIEKQELSHYFPEMRDRLNDCQFNNCLHYNEPGCAIKEAVNNNEISEERYISYLAIMETMEAKLY